MKFIYLLAQLCYRKTVILYYISTFSALILVFFDSIFSASCKMHENDLLSNFLQVFFKKETTKAKKLHRNWFEE